MSNQNHFCLDIFTAYFKHCSHDPRVGSCDTFVTEYAVCMSDTIYNTLSSLYLIHEHRNVKIVFLLYIVPQNYVLHISASLWHSLTIGVHADHTAYVKIFEGRKYHKFHRRQCFCEILVLTLPLKIWLSIRENTIVKKSKF